MERVMRVRHQASVRLPINGKADSAFEQGYFLTHAFAVDLSVCITRKLGVFFHIFVSSERRNVHKAELKPIIRKILETIITEPR